MATYSVFGALLVAGCTLYFVFFGGWRIPDRLKDETSFGEGPIYVGAAKVRSTWVSTPLAKLCVTDRTLQFRSRLLFPRPIAFHRNDVRSIWFDNDGRVAWTRMHLSLTFASDIGFCFSCRDTEGLQRDLEERGWPLVSPEPAE